MTTLEWVQDLAQDGWHFWVDDGRLRYRAPREALVPSVLERLRAHRDEIRDLKARTPDELALSPLSYGQRALWFLWRLAPDSSAYHQSLPLDIHTAVDPALWREAAGILVQRHPILRTRFPIRRNEPVQQTLSAPWLDWTAAGTTPGGVDLTAALVDAHSRPFDLIAQPPVRFHWFARGDQAALLLLTMHHVACDAWSFEILRRELGAIVDTLAAGRRWTAPCPPHTYVDFVRWQRAMLSDQAGDRLWEFWRQQLAEPRGQLDLPTDRPRPPMASYRGDAVAIDIPAALVARLQDLARARDVTRHVLLLTAFLALLYRWTRQRDVIVGVPTAGRSQPEFAGIVGYFVEPIVLRVQVAEAVTFAGFLMAVKQANHAALAHGDYPFALLVERLRVARDASRSPLFDVTFNFLSRRAAAAASAHEPASTAVLEMPLTDSKFDLTLTIIDDHDAMRATLGFNSDLFDRSTIDRVAGQLVRILDEAAHDPDRPLDVLPLGSDSPPRPALQGPFLNVDALRSVHEQIRERATLVPGEVAVVAHDGRLTYGELVDRASHLAARLVDAGVSAGDLVGLCTARSTELVVGLLGIWQAGAAYVPLDPALPPALRGQMLARTGATCCVIGRWRDPQPPSWTGALIDIDPAGPDSSLPARPVRAGQPPDLDCLAYVIFTSGSTGMPKGVAIEHRALANYVASIIEDLQIEPGARHALASTIGADLGHTAIFPALVTGGSLHIIPEETLTDRTAFAQYLSEHEVDYLKIVPSHFAALVDERAAVLPRRAVVLGGESSPSSWIARLQRPGGCRFFNHYGPTETTVGVMTFAVDPAGRPASGALPLDRAVANCAIWLLDAQGRPVPPGVPGEIFVTGPALARGYFGDAAQTAERFVHAPDGARAYRTGDLARQAADGRLELLGREDRQLKLRGYRIELGQIERTLLEYAGVRQAVVLPDRAGPGASHLIAYVVPRGEPALREAALRTWLAEQLPHYMVPARLVIVDRIALTANGKVDALALRAMATSEDAAGGDGADRNAVHDLVELRLCRIWRRVLGIEDIKPTSDFFVLGGHSLLAVRMASLIADEFGLRLPLAALFTHRTIEQLATTIRASNGQEQAAGVVPIQAGGDRLPLILFPGAGGSLLYFQYLLGVLDPDMPVWGAQMAGLSGGAPIAIDIAALAVTYADAIEQRCRAQEGPQLVGHSFGGLVAFEVARQLRQRGRPVAFVGILDNPAPEREPGDPPARRDRDWLGHIATRIERLYRVDLGLSGDAWRDGDAPASERLVDRLLAAGVLPPDTSRAYFARWVDLYRASVAAADAFHPEGPALDVPLTLFTAAEADAALGRPSAIDPALGWARHTSHAVRVIEVPGTHITMLTEPHVRVLGERLRNILNDPMRIAPTDLLTHRRSE